MDRFLLKANCSVCSTNLNEPDEQTGQELFLPIGDSIDLTCPKCGTIWKFWISIETRQKKIGEKRNKIKD